MIGGPCEWLPGLALSFKGKGLLPLVVAMGCF